MLRRWPARRVIDLCDPQVNPRCAPAADWPQNGSLRLLSFNIQVGISTQRYHHYVTRSWQHLLPHAGRSGNLQRIGDLLGDFDLVALQEVDGKPRIWIVDTQSQTVSPRDVSIVSRTDTTVVVASGVKSGERIVSAGVNSEPSWPACSRSSASTGTPSTASW